ncbi:CYP706 protein [Hibiscus syriacus]|uniref:CYP706 protein n=1 Tax=Hibiscus syriacus TaxID=106335 RepID=A0A6A3CY51_HIBSY|nr:CYP706 protein [Hibiscus syriacus]
MVVGGTDTSSNTIEFTLAEVINNPKVKEKAQKELDEAVGKDNIVEESHIHKLPYLLAIMKESLRLHPVLPLLVPHSPKEAFTVGGYTIRKGCMVFINAWEIHRDPCVWENPSEFNPDRFLNSRWDFSGNDFVAEEDKFDVSEKFGIVLKLKNPLVAIPLPRLSNPALYRLEL